MCSSEILLFAFNVLFWWKLLNEHKSRWGILFNDLRLQSFEKTNEMFLTGADFHNITLCKQAEDGQETLIRELQESQIRKKSSNGTKIKLL